MVGLILGTGGNGADLTQVTAAASDVAKGKVIVGPDGQPITGTLDTYDVTEITPKSTVQTINGPIIIPDSLTVKAVQTQQKTTYPSGSRQYITPDIGKYLSQVTVGKIYTKYRYQQRSSYTSLAVPEYTWDSLLGVLLFAADPDTTSYSSSYKWITNVCLINLSGIEHGDNATSYFWKSGTGFVQGDDITASWADAEPLSFSVSSPYRFCEWYDVVYIYV